MISNAIHCFSNKDVGEGNVEREFSIISPLDLEIFIKSIDSSTTSFQTIDCSQLKHISNSLRPRV
jgi:hypothetical protein